MIPHPSTSRHGSSEIGTAMRFPGCLSVSGVERSQVPLFVCPGSVALAEVAGHGAGKLSRSRERASLQFELHLAQHDGPRALSASQGEWRFDLDAWKKSKDISETTFLYGIAADRLKDYLADKAAAEAAP
jgi:hypothetical protein